MDISRLLELAGTKSFSNDEFMMQRAIAQAQKAKDNGAPPIGCVIVSKSGDIIAQAYNQVFEDHDPTAHAEMVAIRKACKKLEVDDLDGATMYSTLQPCGMCTMASYWAKISRIVYGAGADVVKNEKYFETEKLRTQQYIDDFYDNEITVASGVLADESAKFLTKQK